MSSIQQNISLKTHNTFGVNAHAKYFTLCSSEEELSEILNNKSFKGTKKLLLGGGSNILFTKDFDGLVIKNDVKGIEITEENDKEVTIRAGAGENWDEFVEYTVNNKWSGLENLSYIPGNVGASPIQNIGAYGEEARNTIKEVETIDVKSLQKMNYSNEDCNFGYRTSIFKEKLKDLRIITHVTFLLRKQNVFNLDYGSLKETVENKGSVTLKTIRQSVIGIRRHKLPEPEELGSAGSFFKNPVISEKQFRKIEQKFPKMPSYKMAENEIKIPAAWLIDQLGWKGYREGDAGVHENQALVLVNYGNATGKEIYDLSRKIIKSVEIHYGIKLDYEVNII
ncbi:MAG: UDP-N-acetylmuramate dehydrogenase [Bacteroidales bacterium]